MKISIRITLILISVFVTFVSCSKSVEDLQSDGSQKGFATGKVVNSQGIAIAGAKILLDNTVGYAAYINGSTKEDGTYKIEVQPGSWRTSAYVEQTYNGEKYTMELFPDKTDSFTEQGAVRNFIWKLEGELPWEWEATCGGSVTLSTDYGFYEDEEDIELTFTPKGPLIDGSKGRTLVLRYGEEKWRNRAALEDIPIGRYTVRAALKKGARLTPLKIDNWYKQDGLETDYELNFIPKPNGGVSNSASIVIGY